MTPTPLWIPLTMGLVFAVASFASWRSVAEVDRQQRDATAHQIVIDAYASDVRLFDQAVQQRAICLDGVARSDLNRGQWELVAQAFRDAGRSDVAELLDSGPLLSSLPRTVEDCGPSPVAPTAPAGVSPIRTTPEDTTP